MTILASWTEGKRSASEKCLASRQELNVMLIFGSSGWPHPNVPQKSDPTILNLYSTSISKQIQYFHNF